MTIECSCLINKRTNYYVWREYSDNHVLLREVYMFDKEHRPQHRHREKDNPASLTYNETGEIWKKEWYLDDECVKWMMYDVYGRVILKRQYIGEEIIGWHLCRLTNFTMSVEWTTEGHVILL